jgi:hypothetical protein
MVYIAFEMLRHDKEAMDIIDVTRCPFAEFFRALGGPELEQDASSITHRCPSAQLANPQDDSTFIRAHGTGLRA